MMKLKKVALILLLLALLSPLGLLIPQYFHAGDAWGEWSLNEIQKQVGYIPKGMQNHQKHWKALAPDYSLPNHKEINLTYIGSAIIGMLAVGGIVYGIGKILVRKENNA